MTDLITRLRTFADMLNGGHAQRLTREAADEIERLRQLNVELANQLNNKP